ncbi:MAG: ABC transporter ATP-binding protein [Candidatus ainarchaeum sp.]|nr:ABC transporter ATP-binding protein [Candidatus ainarchaeum sp.]
MLSIQNLHKRFGGVKAVDDCSFQVKEGTITALIGPNGSGKTTVFNLVCGVLQPDSGKIVFSGKQISKLKPETISNLGISRLFQQARLFGNITVRENLLLAFDNEDTKFWKNFFGMNPVAKQKEEKVSEVLKTIGMEKFENKQAKELSYGQKRLVELARAMINPHKLLMLDEPVAGVNPKLRREIAELLLKLKKQGETVFLIEHDMNFTLGVADNVVVMDEGKVIAEGTPQKIKDNTRVLEAYLGE